MPCGETWGAIYLSLPKKWGHRKFWRGCEYVWWESSNFQLRTLKKENYFLLSYFLLRLTVVINLVGGAGNFESYIFHCLHLQRRDAVSSQISRQSAESNEHPIKLQQAEPYTKPVGTYRSIGFRHRADINNQSNFVIIAYSIAKSTKLSCQQIWHHHHDAHTDTAWKFLQFY